MDMSLCSAGSGLVGLGIPISPCFYAGMPLYGYKVMRTCLMFFLCILLCRYGVMFLCFYALNIDSSWCLCCYVSIHLCI